MIITHTDEEWRAVRAQLNAIISNPRESAARKAQAQRILAMRPKVRPVQTDAVLFAIEYGL